MKKVLFLVLLFSVVSFSQLQAQSKNYNAPDASVASDTEGKNDYAPDAVVTMGEVVVTATRDAQEVRKTPANVSVITAEEIKESGATTLPEVLENIESVQFRSLSGNASQAYVDVRGIGGDNPYGKTLVMLDGRRLNRTDMASIDWMEIPLNTIEKIEIVRGPSSVLYGDAAISGVINIITKKGQGEPKFNASMLAGSYGLNDERIGVTGATGKWTYAVNGENNFSFGYRERSKYSAQGGGLDLGYSASDLLNVSLDISFNKDDYQMPGALTQAQMSQNPQQYQNYPPELFGTSTPNDDGSNKYANVNLGVKSFFGSWGQMEVNFLYGKKDMQVNMDSWFLYSDTMADTYGITPKYVLAKNIFGFDNKVVVGVDYYNEPYEKDFYNDRERTIKLSTANFIRESLGYYIRDEFSILKNLILSGGYRSERTYISGSNNDFFNPGNSFSNTKNVYDADAYEAGLTWLWGKKSKVFAKYATVYRIPFLDEIACFNGFNEGTLFNTSLKQERGISMETGTEFYPLENLKIGLTLFRMDMADEIMWVNTSPATGENQNIESTRHNGAEISASYLWEKYARFYGNFTYQEATYENGANNKKELWLVPNRMATMGMEIYLPYNLMFRPEIHYVGDCFLSQDYENVGDKLSSYTLINMYLSYKPSFWKIHMTAFLGAENLGNVKYASFGSYNVPSYGVGAPSTYYPMPGVTYKGGISFEF
ncbi:MAG TPA: TonB-dependent receptor [Smithella sp.]|nr:TonB-dependent receptor [Smithella sp.]